VNSQFDCRALTGRQSQRRRHDVGILIVDDGPTKPICFGNGSVVKQGRRRMIK